MPSTASATFEKWNRKLHYYLGLYFLFFLWLFLLTGLLLNHGGWRIAQAASHRTETGYERAMAPPRGKTDLARARDAVRQLDLQGEIEWPAVPPPRGHFVFSVARPKDASQVDIDLATKMATVQHWENGGLTVFRIFHTFSGSRYNAPGQRDWALTTIWVVAMDALAAGLILMVLGGYYMWYRLERTHTLGFLALAAGFASCAMFFASVWR
ncbi:MAG TPA: hypothetical protein VGZ27_15450 [Vicinamibacterales bacterium]|jgi:hypothetical protein|nr:hypothetical protein [Vicinamibacterales bacterium]